MPRGHRDSRSARETLRVVCTCEATSQNIPFLEIFMGKTQDGGSSKSSLASCYSACMHAVEPLVVDDPSPLPLSPPVWQSCLQGLPGEAAPRWGRKTPTSSHLPGQRSCSEIEIDKLICLQLWATRTGRPLHPGHSPAC